MIRDFLHSTLIVILTYSLALSPVAILPESAHAQQQPTSDENLVDRLIAMEVDLEGLIDRAQFPNVPRLSARGQPSLKEVQEIESRVTALTKEMRQGFMDRLRSISSPTLQFLAVQEIGQYYSIARKLESLKIIIGQKVDPSSYESRYGLEFNFEEISQLNFFGTLAFSSIHNVDIEDLVSPQSFPMRSELKTNGKRLSVRIGIDPSFLKDAEYQRFAVQMNMRSSLLFAAHYAAEGLYYAQAKTAYLSAKEDAQVAEPSEYWRSRFASLQVARENILRQRQNQLFAQQKPLLVAAVKERLNEVQKNGKGYVLDADFWQSYQRLLGVSPQEIDLEKDKAEETKAFFLAFTSFVRLWPMENFSANISSAIHFAKRLSMRFLVLNNPSFTSRLDAQQMQRLEMMLNTKIGEFTQAIAEGDQFWAKIRKISEITPQTVRNQERSRFRVQLTRMAETIQHFENREVNLQYLYESKRSEIQALSVSSLVGQVLGALEQTGNYYQGYRIYRQALLNLLQAYRYPVTDKLTIQWLIDNQKKISFNPESLVESVPSAYIKALADDKAGRQKDLSDILALGRILKFDIYETLPLPTGPDAFGSASSYARPTLDNLKIHDGRVFAGERAAYKEAIQKDILEAAPVLNLRNLYKALVSDKFSINGRDQLIAQNIEDTYKQAQDNLKTLGEQTTLIEQGPENSLANVGSTMRILVSRTSQMGLVLGSVSGFSSYFDEIRRELLLPGYWGDQWAKFNSWTNMANLALIVFFAANMMTRFSAVAGRVSDVVIYLLSPIFGPNLKYLGPAIWTLIGINFGSAVVRGGVDHYRAGVLKDFYQCNASAPCLALYSDVLRQEEIRNASISEAVTLVAGFALIMGAFLIAAGVTARVASSLSQRMLRQLEADMQTLGIQRGGSLSPVALNNARGAVHSRLNSVSNPVAKELSSIYVEQAYSRLQSLILKESRKFAKFDRRVKGHTDKLGLSLGEAKNIETLAARHGQIEQAYKSGQITSAEYVDKTNSVFAVYSAYRPIWDRMSSNPNLSSFYEAIWNVNIPAGQARVMVRALDQNLLKNFSAKMDEFYGVDSRQADGLAKKILDELEKSPEISAERIKQLRRLVTRSRK